MIGRYFNLILGIRIPVKIPSKVREPISQKRSWMGWLQYNHWNGYLTIIRWIFPYAIIAWLDRQESFRT